MSEMGDDRASYLMYQNMYVLQRLKSPISDLRRNKVYDFLSEFNIHNRMGA